MDYFDVAAFLKRLASETIADNCLNYAAAVAYYCLFSLFPFILFLLSLLAYLPGRNLQAVIMEWMKNVLPAQALDLVDTNITTLFSEQKGGILSFGAIMTLITAAGGMTSLMDALNHVHNVPETRNFLLVQSIGIGLVIGASLLLAAAAAILIFGDQVERLIYRLRPTPALRLLWKIGRWTIPILAMLIAIATIYRFGPDTAGHWHISTGTIFAVACFLGASRGFSFYVNRFGTYNASYGSIGGVIVLLTWLYVVSLVIILGAEIDTVAAQMSDKVSASAKPPGEYNEQ